MSADGLTDHYRGRSVLVTGSTGLLGRWTVARLQACGAEVTGLARTAPDGVDHRVVAVDIRDPDPVRAAVEAAAPDVLVHLAAQAHVRRARARETIATNVLGTVHVLEAAAAVGVPVMLATGSSRDPASAQAGTEWADAYNASKAAAEPVVALFRAQAAAATPRRVVATVRPGVLLGGGDPAPDRLVPSLVATLRAGGEPTPAQPTAYRPWVHALDVAVGVLWLGARAGTLDRVAATYGFGPAPGTPELSVGALALRVAELWRGEDAGSGGAAAEDGFGLDDRRTARDLGWSATWDTHRALIETVEWYRAQQQGPVAAARLTRAQVARHEADAARLGQPWAARTSVR